jgi:hypothetical protein
MQMIWDSLLHLLNNCDLIDELGETLAELIFADPELSNEKTEKCDVIRPIFRQRRQTTS